MDLSILIPTRGRAGSLATCVARLAAQHGIEPEAYEVVVGFDGPDPEAEAAAAGAWRDAGGRPGGLRLEVMPRVGYIAVRAGLVATLAGRTYLSMNDDVEPDPGFLAAHRAAQAAAPGVVVGDSRFVAWPDTTMLDRLLDATGLVFFYHAMDPEDPARVYGFRHAFGLNASMPMAALRAAGGVPAMPSDTYGYDDVELARRVLAVVGGGVRYVPAARAPHRHRYRAADLLRRERALGAAAARYAAACPGFAAEVFGREILDPAELAAERDRAADHAAEAARLEPAFLALDDRPASAAAHDDPEAIAATFRPLRRQRWREGLLAEVAAGEAIGARA